jgi:hypothetical protein
MNGQVDENDKDEHGNHVYPQPFKEMMGKQQGPWRRLFDHLLRKCRLHGNKHKNSAEEEDQEKCRAIVPGLRQQILHTLIVTGSLNSGMRPNSNILQYTKVLMMKMPRLKSLNNSIFTPFIQTRTE